MYIFRSLSPFLMYYTSSFDFISDILFISIQDMILHILWQNVHFKSTHFRQSFYNFFLIYPSPPANKEINCISFPGKFKKKWIRLRPMSTIQSQKSSCFCNKKLKKNEKNTTLNDFSFQGRKHTALHLIYFVWYHSN